MTTAIQAAISPQPSKAIIGAYCENEQEAAAQYSLALSRSQSAA